MSKWVACGSVSNPKKAREYIRFYSKIDWQTEEEAQQEAKLWEEEKRYPFIWVEKRRLWERGRESIYSPDLTMTTPKGRRGRCLERRLKKRR